MKRNAERKREREKASELSEKEIRQRNKEIMKHQIHNINSKTECMHMAYSYLNVKAKWLIEQVIYA
jgi:hypothetical protein